MGLSITPSGLIGNLMLLLEANLFRFLDIPDTRAHNPQKVNAGINPSSKIRKPQKAHTTYHERHIRTMQNTLRKSKYQVKVTGSPVLSKEFLEDPFAILDMKSSNRDISTRLLGLLMWFRSAKKYVCPSLLRMALKLECSERTIRRKLDMFCEDGILQKIYRHKQTSVYKLNQALFAKDMLELLSPRIPFAKKLLAILILSPFSYMGQMWSQKNTVTPNQNTISGCHVRLNIAMLYINNRNNYLLMPSIFPDKPPGGDYISEPSPFGPYYVRPMVEKEEKVMNLPRVSRLTDDAKVHLTAFPQEVIENALSTMDKFSGIKNRIRWLWSHCSTLCKQRGISPDWNISDQIRKQVNPPENPEIYKKSIPFKDLPKVCDRPPSKPPTINRTPATPEQLKMLEIWGIAGPLNELRNHALEREKGTVHEDRTIGIRDQGGSNSSSPSTTCSSKNLRFPKAA
jgi:hypothetical protein